MLFSKANEQRLPYESLSRPCFFPIYNFVYMISGPHAMEARQEHSPVVLAPVKWMAANTVIGGIPFIAILVLILHRLLKRRRQNSHHIEKGISKASRVAGNLLNPETSSGESTPETMKLRAV